jgi:hypothetical protein
MAFGRASASADAMLDRAGGRPAWIRPIRCGFNRQPEQILPELVPLLRQGFALCLVWLDNTMRTVDLRGTSLALIVSPKE